MKKYAKLWVLWQRMGSIWRGSKRSCLRQKITETVRKAIGAAIQTAFFFGEAVMEKIGLRAKIKAK